MRNISGYTRDCEKSGIAPSLFQILLFLYHGDMVITPPFWMPIWLLVVLHHVLAYWVGAGLLGLVPNSGLGILICGDMADDRDLQVPGELPRV